MVDERTSVLVLDDNDHQHELFSVYASISETVDLLHSTSLEEALDILNGHKPDLILLDNRLHPFVSYRETVPLLREAGYDQKIIVISADIDDVEFADASEHGVDRCVNKFDFTLDNFDEYVADLLK